MDTDTDNRMRTLSLFSGIGGVELGLRRWCRTVCYIEIDGYAQATLCKNMAAGNLDAAPIWDDVTTFGEDEIEAVGGIDCVTGGFPCQDISCAGKGAGIHGKRSGLFCEIIRIVRLARPSILFLENVPALLNRGMDTVLRELSESGYDARWRVLSAAEVGAPHKRDRVWILANAERAEPGTGEAGIETEAWQRGCGPANGGAIISVATIKGLEGAIAARKLRRKQKRLSSQCNPEWWSVEPDVGRVADGVPFELECIRGLSDEQNDNKKKNAEINGAVIRRFLRSVWKHRKLAQTSPREYRRKVLDSVCEMPRIYSYEGWYVGARIEETEKLRDLWERIYTEPLEKTQDLQQELLERIRQEKRPSALEFRTDRLKCLGNAVVPACAEKAFELLMNGASNE